MYLKVSPKGEGFIPSHRETVKCETNTLLITLVRSTMKKLASLALKGLQQMLSCTAAHFDAGYKLNQWAWVTNCWEISLVPQVKNLPVLTRWLEGIRTRWPNAECLTQGDFGSL